MNFVFKDTLNINNFTVKLYHNINEDIDMSIVNSVLTDTLVLDFPNKIIERLQDIAGVSKVEIYNSNNELLINSEKVTL
jgi:hypothetical protein